MDKEHIHPIVKILKSEIKKWKVPAVGVVAEESRDPFKVLISCLLSLRTQDNVTDQASHRLFREAQTPEAMLKLKKSQIEKLIYPVCFYRTKALRIHEICDALIHRYHGKVPSGMEDLLSLNGVGRKTANLVITLGFDQDGICVDTHVHRISNRLGYLKTKMPDETESKLRKILPLAYWKIYNDLLVPFGQNLCRPLSPFCSRCPIEQYCDKVGVRQHR
jgi:endonuclease-3